MRDRSVESFIGFRDQIEKSADRFVIIVITVLTVIPLKRRNIDVPDLEIQTATKRILPQSGTELVHG